MTFLRKFMNVHREFMSRRPVVSHSGVYSIVKHPSTIITTMIYWSPSYHCLSLPSSLVYSQLGPTKLAVHQGRRQRQTMVARTPIDHSSNYCTWMFDNTIYTRMAYYRSAAHELSVNIHELSQKGHELRLSS